MTPYTRIAGHAGLIVFVVAAAFFGARLSAIAGMDMGGFSHRTHPVAWLGAAGVPGAGLFNLFGFVMTGLLAAFALWPLRPALPSAARWSARIGTQLVFLSALAFAAQGLFPLDLTDPDGVAGGLHAIAWTAWCLSFCAGALALAWGLGLEHSRRGLIAVCVAAGLAVPALGLIAPLWLPNAFVQRAAFVSWLCWVAWISQSPPSTARS